MVDFWTFVTMCPNQGAGWLIPIECKYGSIMVWFTVVLVIVLIWWVYRYGPAFVTEDSDD